MSHIINSAADDIIDQEFKVLDKGFVRLVDYMGGDDRICQAARVSYGAGTKSIRSNVILIDYLMAHEHTSPFEHVVFEFHCKMPIFVARQWVRHRTARINEISGRYSEMPNQFYAPALEQIQYQSKDNKQGRSEEEVPELIKKTVLSDFVEEQVDDYKNYNDKLTLGIAKELARINLPLSLYTEMYWQMDLHNLFHFLKLRLDQHAQWEIRQYGEAIAHIVKIVCPVAWAAFERNVLNRKPFTQEEIETINEMLDGKSCRLAGQKRIDFYQKLGREMPNE